MAKAEAAQGQTAINQKAVAIAAEMVLLAVETAAAVAVAAAMATVAMAATTTHDIVHDIGGKCGATH